MSITSVEVDKSKITASISKRLFSLTMLIATLAPVAFFLIIYTAFGGLQLSAVDPQLAHARNTLLIFALVILSRGHVGLSFLMYLDKEFQPIIRKHKYRFIVIPLVLAIILPLFLMNNQLLFNTALFTWVAWTIWHFSRQNTGICALISIADGKPTPGRFEKNLINLSCIIAIIGHYPLFFPKYFETFWFHSWLSHIGEFAIYPFLLVVAFGIGHLIKNHSRYSATTGPFFLLAMTMFGTIFLARDFYQGNAFVIYLGYQTAHGLQYIVIMYLMTISAGAAGKFVFDRNPNTAGQREDIIVWRLIAAASTSLILLAWIVYLMNSPDIISQLNGNDSWSWSIQWLAAFGVTVLFIHFIIDAGAFRLSQKAQRDWVRSRLGFIFKQ